MVLEDTQKKLTEAWLENMDRQLNTISVTSALISSLVVSALAWPSVASPGGEDGPSSRYDSGPVRCLWYISLLFSLTSIATATNQNVVIHRLSCFSDSLERTRRMLGESGSAPVVPDMLQLWIWQIPIAFLNGSVYTFVAGLAVIVWGVAKDSHLDFQFVDTKVLIVFMVGLSVCVPNYLLGTYGLYGKIGLASS
ncbi:hypothetical protein B0I35DRAFT_114324 [Stachybotrys elegans]|uniref:Uncharacterized protein n=1 Tax=Stachybotrys elegans TaxID=80388 RepID=A0A8K0WLX1_9HYPO|nr:hypothetical protein B0I35DRAFT_114324 [Stachybotrys elegans]